MKYKDIELIPENDDRYLVFREKLSLKNMHLRESLEATNIQKITKIIEQIVQEFFARNINCTQSKILRYLSLHGIGHYEENFREIDVVIGEKSNPQIIVEIKTTANVENMLKKASNQVFKTWKLIKVNWYEAIPVTVIIALGDQQSSENWKLSELNAMINLVKESSGTITYPSDVPAFVISSKEVWNWCVSNHIVKDKDELFIDATKDANDLINFRIQRKSLIEDGIPVEEWPSELTNHSTQDTPDPTIYSTNEKGMNEFQMKLLEALKKNQDQKDE